MVGPALGSEDRVPEPELVAFGVAGALEVAKPVAVAVPDRLNAAVKLSADDALATAESVSAPEVDCVGLLDSVTEGALDAEAVEAPVRVGADEAVTLADSALDSVLPELELTLIEMVAVADGVISLLPLELDREETVGDAVELLDCAPDDDAVSADEAVLLSALDTVALDVATAV